MIWRNKNKPYTWREVIYIRLSIKFTSEFYYYLPESDANLHELAPTYDFYYPYIEHTQTWTATDRITYKDMNFFKQVWCLIKHLVQKFVSLYKTEDIEILYSLTEKETIPFLLLKDRRIFFELLKIERVMIKRVILYMTYNPHMPQVLISSETELQQPVFTLDAIPFDTEQDRLIQSEEPSFESLCEMNYFVSIGISDEDKRKMPMREFLIQNPANSKAFELIKYQARYLKKERYSCIGLIMH